MPFPAYHSTLRGILYELDIHQPSDLKTLREYSNLVMVKFPSYIDSSVQVQVRRQILVGDYVPLFTPT